jgi:ABC-type branched-subunit amino acid transport system permease subunit
VSLRCPSSSRAASGRVLCRHQAGFYSAVDTADQQARAASLQIVIIGVMLCIILLWRPQGILPETRSVSRHLGRRNEDK